MKYVKHLVTAAAALMALTAIIGAGTASAAPTFGANAYPAMMVGDNAQHTLVVDKGAVNCKGPSFFADLGAAGSNLATTTEDSTCQVFGSDKPLKMNGCKFTFSVAEKLADGTYKGSYSIGPEGCGPITTTISTCLVSIPAQSGLAAKFENVAGSKTVKITSEASNLKYSQSGCGSSGSWSNGYYGGTWLVSAYSGNWPSGAQVASQNHVFSAGGVTVKCGEATFSMSPGLVSTRTITPQYNKCQPFGFVNGTVNMNGCTYVAQATSVAIPKSSGKVDISCPAGKTIEITAVGCAVSIPPQTGLSGFSAEEKATTTAVQANFSGIEYTVTTDMWFCPFNGTGTHNDGTYTGETTLEGKLVSASGWSVSGS